MVLEKSMIAVDTNLLVRIVTGDNPEQQAVARAALEGQDYWISKTVSLELEWVLRYSYELNRESIAGVFRRLLGHRNAVFEDRTAIIRALGWHRAGLDFADALHLASAGDARQLWTFDQKFVKRAQALALPVRSVESP